METSAARLVRALLVQNMIWLHPIILDCTLAWVCACTIIERERERHPIYYFHVTENLRNLHVNHVKQLGDWRRFACHGRARRHTSCQLWCRRNLSCGWCARRKVRPFMRGWFTLAIISLYHPLQNFRKSSSHSKNCGCSRLTPTVLLAQLGKDLPHVFEFQAECHLNQLTFPSRRT